MLHDMRRCLISIERVEGERKNESVDSWNAKGVRAEVARGRTHPPRKRRRGSQPRVSEGNNDSPNNRSIFYHHRAIANVTRPFT